MRRGAAKAPAPARDEGRVGAAANDPIFAAIKRCAEARDAFERTNSLEGVFDGAERPQRVQRAYQSLWNITEREEKAALDALARTAPTTLGGVRELLTFLRTKDYLRLLDDVGMAELLRTLIASPALSDD